MVPISTLFDFMDKSPDLAVVFVNKDVTTRYKLIGKVVFCDTFNKKLYIRPDFKRESTPLNSIIDEDTIEIPFQDVFDIKRVKDCV